MMSQIERTKPVVKTEGGRVIQEHPSYGLISITHPSGGRVEMFGSDIPHDQRVALRIQLAYEECPYGVPEYRTKPKGRLLELEMTAYQWAGLVASHSGRGVPCTLRYANGENIPMIQGQLSNEGMANKEIAESLKELLSLHREGIEDIRNLVGKGKANKKELADALGKLERIYPKLPEITAFAVDVFKENAEVIVAKSQSEVEATIQNLIVQTGVKALGIQNNNNSDARHIDHKE